LPQLNESIGLDELEEPGDEVRIGASLPDPAVLGLRLGKDVHSAAPGALGCGRLLNGRIGSVDCSFACLVSELHLPRPVEPDQLQWLSKRFQKKALLREDLSAPLGAVPAKVADEGMGICIAWSDPLGAARGSAMPLEKALQSESAQCPQWRLSVARQLCVALAALRNSGRSHGSFSPRNVWVSPSGEVAVMEAGFADSLLLADVLRQNELPAHLGLDFAKYLAPEGWQLPRRAGPAADVWSLGLVLLEVLGGASPPHAECSTLEQLHMKLQHEKIHGQHAVGACRSREFDTLPEAARCYIEACFRLAPEKRPEAQEVLFSLAAPPDDDPAGMASAPQQKAATACSGPQAADGDVPSWMHSPAPGSTLGQAGDSCSSPTQRRRSWPQSLTYEEFSAEMFVPAPREKWYFSA